MKRYRLEDWHNGLAGIWDFAAKMYVWRGPTHLGALALARLQ